MSLATTHIDGFAPLATPERRHGLTADKTYTSSPRPAGNGRVAGKLS